MRNELLSERILVGLKDSRFGQGKLNTSNCCHLRQQGRVVLVEAELEGEGLQVRLWVLSLKDSQCEVQKVGVFFNDYQLRQMQLPAHFFHSKTFELNVNPLNNFAVLLVRGSDRAERDHAFGLVLEG
jgi:hypothetical protein